MYRREAMKTFASALVGATVAAPLAAQPIGTEQDKRDFVVHSGAGGFVILQNGTAEDYSLRMVSADGATSLKYLRLTGPDALAELSDIYRTLTFLSEKFGVPID